MNKYVEIKSDITPENLEAKVREYAHQVAAEQMRSMLSAHRAASFHGLRPRHGAPLTGIAPPIGQWLCRQAAQSGLARRLDLSPDTGAGGGAAHD